MEFIHSLTKHDQQRSPLNPTHLLHILYGIFAELKHSWDIARVLLNVKTGKDGVLGARGETL